PRPDRSDAPGAPNAGTDCHADRTNTWAAEAIALRHTGSRHRGAHYGQAFAAARFDPAAATETVLAIAEDRAAPAIVRATALELLRPVTGPELAARAQPLLADPSPLVRDQAVGIQRGAPSVQRLERLLPLLEDPVRTVRIAAAREFLDLRMAHMPETTQRALTAANREWQRSLMRKADFPEAHLVIGGAALTFRDMRAAEQAFGEAARLDPQRTDAWSMVIRIRHALGDVAGARAALDEATAANPADFTLISLGSLVEEPGDLE
ncbi:MAG: tetratricopeptide repeat protein, partial [Pseudomonadota bacterium]